MIEPPGSCANLGCCLSYSVGEMTEERKVAVRIGLPARVARDLLSEAELLGTTRSDLLEAAALQYLKAIRSAREGIRRQARHRLERERPEGST